VIVLCQEGYASGFAAESLRQLGHQRVADVIGGFIAWRRAGLPIRLS
jgi:rhodanese-related sulfurtransferase